ncbi:MAG TPA: T9SS type A sorting domain-containing protein [Candidatus Kapabacteria bacterium]|nr:T9SS type A sorting domain-containing protein [Candidatus Kapabacteria bacterium]HPO63837.1 T9SS type A sorting domain-containing protein [Candidatus Kapabacteria bacterium]
MEKFLILILFLLSNCSLFAQWTSDSNLNTMFNSGESKAVLPKIAICPDNSYYVSWNFDDNLNFKTYLTKLSKDGEKLWDSDLLISDNPTKTWISDYSMISDSKNNSIIVFQDSRYTGASNPESDVFAYKINSYGKFQWGANGIKVNKDTAFCGNPVLIETSANNFVIAWTAAPDFYTDTSYAETRIYVTKLDNKGNMLWGKDIVLVEDDWDFMFPILIPSNDDTFILVWMQSEKVDDMPGAISFRYIYAQKYNSNGNPLWATPTVIYDLDGIPSDGYLVHDAKSDGNGGVISVFRSALGKNITTSAQIVNQVGVEQFQHNGVVVSLEEYSDHDYPYFDYKSESKELYVFWEKDLQESTHRYTAIFGNLINNNGERVWGDNGKEFVELTDILEPAPFICGVEASDSNDVNVLYSISNKRHPSFEDATDKIYAMRINNHGNYVWEQEKILLCNNNSYKGRVMLSKFKNNMWVAYWEDARNSMSTSDFDIFAQNINDDGTLGKKSSSVNNNYNSNHLLIYPNPSNDYIYINLDYGNIQISDIYGKVILKKDFIGNEAIDITNLSIGTYFCTVRNGNNIETLRFSVIR